MPAPRPRHARATQGKKKWPVARATPAPCPRHSPVTPGEIPGGTPCVIPRGILGGIPGIIPGGIPGEIPGGIPAAQRPRPPPPPLQIRPVERSFFLKFLVVWETATHRAARTFRKPGGGRIYPQIQNNRPAGGVACFRKEVECGSGVDVIRPPGWGPGWGLECSGRRGVGGILKPQI
eukprot:gene18378-biopygen9948